MDGSQVAFIVLSQDQLLMARGEDGLYRLPQTAGADNALSAFTGWTERTLHTPLEAKLSFTGDGFYVMGSLESPREAENGLQWIDLHRRGEMAPEVHAALAGLYRAVPAGYRLPASPLIWQLYVQGGATAYYAVRQWTLDNARKHVDAQTPAAVRWTVMLLALALAILFDVFFLQEDPGVSAPLYVLLFLAAAVFLHRGRPSLTRPMPWALAASAFLLSIGWALHNDPVLLLLNTLAVPLLLAAMLRILSDDSGASLSRLFGNTLEKLLLHPLAYFYILFPTLRRLLKRDKPGRRPLDRGVLAGILTAIPLFIVIALLLASSDLVLADLLGGLFRRLSAVNLGEIPLHLLAVCLLLLYFFGLLWPQLYYMRLPSEPSGAGSGARLQPITGIIILAPLILLYALFVGIQFAFLFSGGGHLPHCLTYAEYAHRGFAQLIVVALINMALLILFRPKVKTQKDRRVWVLRQLMTLVVLCTLVILSSALYRMLQYMGAYGYTWLRVTVSLFIGMLGAMQLALLLGVYRAGLPLGRCLAAIMLVFYIGINFLGIDARVAAGNIRRYEQGMKLDTDYIADELGCDAAGAVLCLGESGDAAVREAVDAYMTRNAESLHSCRGLAWNLGRARFNRAYDRWTQSR